MKNPNDINAESYDTSCAACGWIDFTKRMCTWHRRDKYPTGIQCTHFIHHLDLKDDTRNHAVKDFIDEQNRIYQKVVKPSKWQES